MGQSIPSLRTLIPRIRDNMTFLAQFQDMKKSTYFELMCMQAFARLLKLPFFDVDHDDNSVQHRVTWNGRVSPISKAPDGPDGIARCHDFDMLVEATRKEGTKQYTQEYTRAITHWEQYLSTSTTPPGSIYLLLVCTKLHETSFNACAARAYPIAKMIPVEFDVLLRIMTTAKLSITLTHSEIRKVLLDIYDCIPDCHDLKSFRHASVETAERWQENVLRHEKEIFLAMQSYRAIRKLGYNLVGTSQIFNALLSNPTVNQYFSRLGHRFSDTDPEELYYIVSKHGFALGMNRTPAGEHLLAPVPVEDFALRCHALMEAANQ